MDVYSKCIKVQWGAVPTADGYDVFVGRCYKRLNVKNPTKTVQSGTKTTTIIKKLARQKVNGKYNYKVRVKAYKMVNGKKVYIATSLILRSAGSKSVKYTNAKKVKVVKKRYTIRKGKSTMFNAKSVKKKTNRKLILESRKTRLRYYSTDKSVAKVSKKGRVTAVGAGKCTIYIVDQNGVRSKVKVTVK